MARESTVASPARTMMLAAFVVLALAPLTAPLLESTHPLAAWMVRSFFSRLCHQRAARSFIVAGSPVAVCVRCLGIYLGAALGAMLRWKRSTVIRCLAVAVLLNGLEVSLAAITSNGDWPAARFLLGLLLGAGAGGMLFLQDEAEKPLPGPPKHSACTPPGLR